MTDPTWLLYANPLSGNAWKAQQILTSAGIPYRSEEVPVVGDRDTARRGTPVGEHHVGRIPLLIGPDGERLAESNAILLWFGERAGLLPTESMARHRVLEWLFFEQSQVLPSLATCRYLIRVAGVADQQPQVIAFLQGRGRATLDAIERRLAAPDAAGWLANGACSIADVAVYPYTRMAPQAGIDLDPWPAIRSWHARVEAREDFVSLPCL